MKDFDSNKWNDCITRLALKPRITSEPKSGVCQWQLVLNLVFGECRANPEISQDTRENSISLYFHSSGFVFGTHSDKPPALSCAFKASVSYGTSTNGSLIRHRAVQLFPYAQRTLWNVCGCAKQQWGSKCWGREGFTVVFVSSSFCDLALHARVDLC